MTEIEAVVRKCLVFVFQLHWQGIHWNHNTANIASDDLGDGVVSEPSLIAVDVGKTVSSWIGAHVAELTEDRMKIQKGLMMVGLQKQRVLGLKIWWVDQ